MVATSAAGVKFAFFGNLVLFDSAAGSGYRAVWWGFPSARVSYVLSTWLYLDKIWTLKIKLSLAVLFL